MTVRVYHIQDGNASAILYLYQKEENVWAVETRCTEKIIYAMQI